MWASDIGFFWNFRIFGTGKGHSVSKFASQCQRLNTDLNCRLQEFFFLDKWSFWLIYIVTNENAFNGSITPPLCFLNFIGFTEFTEFWGNKVRYNRTASSKTEMKTYNTKQDEDTVFSQEKSRCL